MNAQSIDWNAVALWAGGVTTVLASIGIAIWQAVTRASRVAAQIPASSITREDTKIITTDTVAMNRLSGQLETANERALTTWQVMKELTEATEANSREVHELAVGITEHNRLAQRVRDDAEEVRSEIRELTRQLQRRP